MAIIGWQEGKEERKENLGQSLPQQPKRKEEKAPRRKRDANLIKPGTGKTYAEILGQIKAKVKSSELNTEVKLVCKTGDGGLLMVVGKSDDEMKSLQEAIRAAIGQAGTVKSRISKTILEIKDIDSVTTKDEVVNVITAEMGSDEEDPKVYLFESNTREQRVAVVEMDQTKAAALVKMLSLPRIRIR